MSILGYLIRQPHNIVEHFSSHRVVGGWNALDQGTVDIVSGGNGGTRLGMLKPQGSKVRFRPRNNLQTLSAESSPSRTQNAPKILAAGVTGPQCGMYIVPPDSLVDGDGFIGRVLAPSPHEPYPWLSSSGLELRPLWPRLALAMFISFRRLCLVSVL